MNIYIYNHIFVIYIINPYALIIMHFDLIQIEKVNVKTYKK